MTDLTELTDEQLSRRIEIGKADFENARRRLNQARSEFDQIADEVAGIIREQRRRQKETGR